MAVNTQFSIAVHLMLALGYAGAQSATSSELARSINTSPSFVRRILAKLSKANLVSTTTGKTGSCRLAKKAEDVSILEIYRAVDAPETFTIHDYPVQNSCLVSCNIEAVMQKILDRAQNQFEASLAETSLAELIGEIRIS